MLPKTSVHIKSYDGETNRCIFLKDDELLETHNDIWNRVSNTIKKVLDC